ncbi:MAG: hypothetical protein A2X32_07850 [Elusimicrobia bacterium GWC2_64_44]|nr:MAG: hypothetical protein A2X32_07850 [Elusimicrobia bacterium GWC2_64_44]
MKKLLMLAAAVLVMAGSADAKWWIFGKSKAEVGLKYLFINKLSADETGPKVKLFREMLGAGGLVKITGRASGGKTGAVRITLDDKATWVDVKFSDNGTFEHSFKPEPGRTYAMLIEVTDTAGRTNKPEDTRKEISLSEENIQAKVKEALDALFAAYAAENLQKFMGGVGEDFAGDKAILERAVKRDFDALSSISLRYTLNNVAAGAQGRVFVSLTFNRLVFVNKSGQTSTDSGSTEFVFGSSEGGLSLYSMKQPLIFGLSDAEGVATGEVLGNTGSTLVLDESGNLGGGELVTIDCRGASWTVMKYTFASEAQACDTGGGGADIWFYDWANNIGYGGATQHKSFSRSLASLTAAEVRDLAGYTAAGNVTGISTGLAYCFELSGSFYCLEPVTIPTSGNPLAAFKVKQF